MTHEQFKEAAEYWTKKEQTDMPREDLKKAIDAYVAKNNTCALATGTGEFVRCTPIEYSFHDEKSGCFQKVERSLSGLRKMQMCVLPSLINMKDLEI